MDLCRPTYVQAKLPPECQMPTFGLEDVWKIQKPLICSVDIVEVVVFCAFDVPHLCNYNT